MAAPIALAPPGMTDYQAYLWSKNAIANTNTQYRNQRKYLRQYARGRGRPSRVAKMMFPDGTSGLAPVGSFSTRRRPARRTRRRYRRRVNRRYPRRYRGRGGYFSDAYNWLRKNIPKGTAEAVGTGLGAFWGDPMTGASWGRKFATITGLGAYNQSDSAAAPEMDQGVPQVWNDRGTDGAMVVRHREYICDIASTGSAFNIAFQGTVNPGIKTSFPWLSDIGMKFSQYRVEGMVFHFVSTSGSLSTTQALGEIIMAANYNVTDPVFSNKQQMLNEIMAVSKVPSIDAELGIECESHQTPTKLLYVRGSSIPGVQDPRFYDLCNVTVATQGQTAAVTLGELWVTYQIALYKPSLSQPGAYGGYARYDYAGAYTPTANWNTFATKTVGIAYMDPIFDMSTNTFIRDFEGSVTISVVGTVLAQASPPTYTGSTCFNAVNLPWLVSTAATVGTVQVNVSAKAGQILNMQYPGTTVTAVQAYFNTIF